MEKVVCTVWFIISLLLQRTTTDIYYLYVGSVISRVIYSYLVITYVGGTFSFVSQKGAHRILCIKNAGTNWKGPMNKSPFAVPPFNDEYDFIIKLSLRHAYTSQSRHDNN